MDISHSRAGVPTVLLAGFPPELAAWLGGRLAGAKIVWTAGGTAALDTLRRGGWALLVLNHPAHAEPAALAMLRQVRAAHDGTALPIVCCLDRAAAASMAPPLLATLGVERLLFQPVDREELARAIAECLGVTLAPASVRPDAARDTAATVAIIWQRLQAPILRRVAVVEQATAALLQDDLDEALRERAFHEAHRLAGSVGTFGFAEGSRLAREAEHLLRQPGVLGPAEAPRLAHLVSKLRHELAQAPGAEPPAAAPPDDGHEPSADDAGPRRRLSS